MTQKCRLVDEQLRKQTDWLKLALKQLKECNRCTCIGSGLRWKCTRRACPEVKIPVNGEGFTCTPNGTFKDDCNTCTCDDSGKLARCTAMACEPKERRKRSNEISKTNNAPTTSTTLAPTQKSPVPVSTPTQKSLASISTPKSSPSISTTKAAPTTTENKTSDKKVVSSTTAAPTVLKTTKAPYNPNGTADRIVTPEELKDPKFTCTPSLSFKVDCNTCWCASNGKETRFCTRIACVKPKQ